jgi:Outer membrane protein beta-barrel domain
MRITTHGLTGAAALLAVGLALPALAEGPRYTYAELGYQRVDFDNFSEDEDAGYLAGSLGLNDRLFLAADASYGTIDVSGNDIDVTTIDAGLGMHLPLNETVDFVAGVAYVYVDINTDRYNISQDDDGYALRAGLRAMLTPKLELNGGATYVDISGDDNTSAYFGAVYSFTDAFAVTGSIDVGDNATTYGVGARLYFDVR